MTFYDRGIDDDRNSAAPNQGYYFGGFTQAYDGAGRLQSVTGDTAGTYTMTNILSNATSYPSGQQYTATKLGQYNITRTYSNRGWYTGQTIANSSATIWSSTASYNPTGTVKASTDTYAGSWTNGYDHLNRIANAAGPGGSTAYTIDAFGNKTVQTTKSGSAPSPNYSAALSNGLTGNGVTYDLANYAGNVTLRRLPQLHV